MESKYTTYSSDQISKIANTIIYIASKIKGISKTKVLKLLYILDELSIKKSGIPFLNLKYKVWKFGPVSEDIFIDLSTSPTILKGFIESKINKEGNKEIFPLKEFNDDEFSQNNLELLDYVILNFGSKTAKELISYTHREKAPWHNAALENSVLDLLIEEKISNTEFLINFKDSIAHDERKTRIYEDYLEFN